MGQIRLDLVRARTPRRGFRLPKVLFALEIDHAFEQILCYAYFAGGPLTKGRPDYVVHPSS
jgi:hypothetical protein